jgi:uncharacterized protein YihD (DUF1040 family)
MELLIPDFAMDISAQRNPFPCFKMKVRSDFRSFINFLQKLFKEQSFNDQVKEG